MQRPNLLINKIIRIHQRSLKTKAFSDEETFGTLSDSGRQTLALRAVEKRIPEDPDGYDKEEFDLGPRKNEYYYKYEITKYARQGSIGLRKALELFDTMKSKDRVTPSIQNFSPLIYGCAKAGYTKRAFELYEESLKYKNKPTKSTVTCLLNACAESPFPEYGLKRLDWFRQHLKFDHNYELNRVHYHAAIKAYGKLGQLDEASKLIQEMIDNGFTPDAETFNMLLMGCASNKKAGCTLAFRIYKRMRLYSLQPSVHTYKLLLRCIRDCDMGSRQLIKQALAELPAMTSFEQRLKYKGKGRRKDKSKDFEWLPLLDDLGNAISSAVEESSTSTSNKEVRLIEGAKKIDDDRIVFSLNSSPTLALIPESRVNIPNLLSDDHLDLIYRVEAINFDQLKNSSDRLKLFGGLRGFLATMTKNNCQPDNKTFSLLLDCLPHNEKQQHIYFQLAQTYQVKRDLLFYDLLLRHICSDFKDSGRLDRALKYIEEMHKDDLRPNISTFDSIALGCDSLKQANKLISDVESCGLTISDHMIKNFFVVAMIRLDFTYLNGLIRLSKKYKLRPTRNLVDKLEAKRLLAHDTILKFEKGRLKEEDVPNWLNEEQIANFDLFNKSFGRWLNSVNLAEEDHPWSQFHVEYTYKKRGFSEFVQKFKALERERHSKREEEGKLFNMHHKSEALRQHQ